jgi:hypothetical protein
MNPQNFVGSKLILPRNEIVVADGMREKNRKIKINGNSRHCLALS